MQHASQLDSQWPALVSRLSEVIDLDASARETRALLRRREVRSAEALLRLILAYAPGGLSLRSAAAWADASGLASLSDTAVMNRIRGAADWLGAIAGALPRRGQPGQPGQPAAAAAVLAGRRKHRKCRARSAMRSLTLPSTGFLMVLTSLPPTVSAAEMLAAWRLR